MKKPTTILEESVSEYREFVQLRLRKGVLEAIEVVLEEEVNQALGCGSYERAEDRRGYRNGAETRPVPKLGPAGQLGSSPAGIYHVSMTSFRISVTVLAVIHAVFAGFTALVGAFANGGDVWQRLLVVLLHPLGAAGLLLLVLRPRLATTKILAMMALLTANVIADLWVAQMISAGRVRGDWELALAFSVVPAVGIVYAFALLRTAR